jgi:Tol biopolymer transport system component
MNLLAPHRAVRLALVVGGSIAGAADAAAQGPCPLELLSLDPLGAQLGSHSFPGALTPDGRYLLVNTDDSTLIPGDNLDFPDVFVLDTAAGQWSPISVGLGGAVANASSSGGALSADARKVAFLSFASNLTSGDIQGTPDVFVRDRVLGVTTRYTSTPFTDIGSYYPGDVALSGDGRYLAFRGYRLLGETPLAQQAYRVDLASGALARASSDAAGAPGNGSSFATALSFDGRFVAFASAATNLVAGDTNDKPDVFVRDMLTNTIERVNLGPGGVQSLTSQPGASAVRLALTPDARFVAFLDAATNWGLSSPSANAAVYVRDRALGLTSLASPTLTGAALDGACWELAISADGDLVAFSSYSSNLAANDDNPGADIFVHERAAGFTRLATRSTSGGPANGHVIAPLLSGDGSRLVFASSANNLVGGDTNGAWDVFADECGPIVGAYCTARVNSLGCTPAVSFTGAPSISSPTPFVIGASQVINNRSGLLFYGFASASAPYLGGTLCVAPPHVRTALQSSGGSAAGLDCSGSFSFDFGAHLRSGVDPQLGVGRHVYAQFWSRDPGASPPTNLTDALRMLIVD